MNVLGISGSLRKDSFNAMALRAAQKLAPAGMSVSIGDISQIPLYNEEAVVPILRAELELVMRQCGLIR